MATVIAVPYFTDHGAPCCRAADPCPAHTDAHVKLISITCMDCDGRGFNAASPYGDRRGLCEFCDRCDGSGNIAVTP